MSITGRVYTLAVAQVFSCAVYRYSRAVARGYWTWRVWRGLAWLALRVGELC